MLAPQMEPLSGRPRKLAWALALASGPLITLSQPPADVPLIGLVGLAPLLVALPRLSAGGSWLAGWLVGLCYFWGNMWWLGQMVTDPGNEWIVFAMFAFVATAMAAFWGVAAMISRWLLTRRAAWCVWLVPLAWLGIEFLHEFNTPAPYPWLPLGAALCEMHLLIQTADIWGQYGLTLLLVLVNLALARSLQIGGPGLPARSSAPFGTALAVVALLLLAAGSLYGWVRIGQIEAAETGNGPAVALVQGNLAQEVKVRAGPERIKIIQESYMDHLRLSQQGVDAGAELVCWAETMVFGGCTRDGLDRRDPAESARHFPDGVPSRDLLHGIVQDERGRARPVGIVENLRARVAYELRTPMLVGAITDIPAIERDVDWKMASYDDRFYNTALLLDAQGRVADSYDKRYLVPGGEYIPREEIALVRALIEYYAQGLQGAVSRVEPGRRLTTFSLPAGPSRKDGLDWAFTASICYEYAWPGCYRELHRTEARYPDFHINISNEGWFKQSSELDQAVDFCRLRCIESRVPMLRATNTGVTCHIDATGRVREMLTLDGKDREIRGVLTVKPAVLRDPGPTLFVALIGRGLGHIAMWTTLALLALMAAGRVQQRLQKRKAAKAAGQ
ncbi:MAG: apolipoprotein N-acyltransferase [Planctomycetes bacterium]|nr:apolipoprotein N-acyltransferase [Planctomycetota bacterium]